MDTKAEEWAKKQGKESSLELDFEGIDHTQVLLLVVQQNCGKGYECIISVLETALSLAASMVCI